MNPTVDQFASPLTDQETREAYGNLVKEHTHKAVIRTGSDPAIPGQTYSLVTFSLFPEPKRTVNGHPIYGMCKVRGVHASLDTARLAVTNLVRNVDSVHQVHVVPTGYWFPLTSDPAASQEQVKVQTSSNAQEQMMFDEVAKKMDQHKSQEYQEKLKQHKEEIEKRAEEVRREAETPEDPYSLDFYTTKRKVEIQLAQQIERTESTIHKLRSTYASLMRTLKDIEARNPEYTDAWLPYHNKVFRERGLPEYVLSADDRERYERWQE